MSCVLCGEENAMCKPAQSHSGNFYDCPACGRFIVEDYLINKFSDKKHLIAGYLNETNFNKTSTLVIYDEIIDYILKHSLIPKTLMQKLHKILLFYYNKGEPFGTEIKADDFVHSYALNRKEYTNMLGAMAELGIITVATTYQGGGLPPVKLTPQGVELAENLLTTNIESNKAFIAMKFNNEMYKAVDNAIRPALNDCGFLAFPVYDKEHNNDINDEIIAGIKTSKFMIADFTYNSYGAYFEAGFAQGLGLEVIRTCNKKWLDEVNEKGEKNKLHFDVEHYSFIMWDEYEDLIKQLKNRIRATIPGAKMTDETGEENE